MCLTYKGMSGSATPPQSCLGRFCPLDFACARQTTTSCEPKRNATNAWSPQHPCAPSLRDPMNGPPRDKITVRFAGSAVICAVILFSGVVYATTHFSDASVRWTVFGVALAVVTAILVLWQIYIAQEQTRLARIQTEIIQRQDEILSQRPQLAIRFQEAVRNADGSFGPIRVTDSLNSTMLMLLEIENSGTRNIIEYKVEFLLPWYGSKENSLSAAPTDDPNWGRFRMKNEGAYTYDLRNYNRWSTVIEHPVLAKTTIELPLLVLNIPPVSQDWSIRWRVLTKEYVFPEDGEFGLLVLRTV